MPVSTCPHERSGVAWGYSDIFSSNGRSKMVLHRTAKVDGLSIFYREAGETGTPKLVLLAG